MAKSISRVIRRDESKKIERWVLPNVENMHMVMSEDGDVLSTTPLTAEQIEKIQRQAYKEAYDEGFEKGYRDGHQESQDYLQQQVAIMNAVLNQCAAPMKQLDNEVENQLVQLAIALTRQLVRREIKNEPGHIVAILREAMEALPVASREVRVFLHPEDSQVITSTLAAGDNQYWKMVEDPTMNRGDCRIQTESSSIDATVERRLSSIIANMLGGERKKDSATSASHTVQDAPTGTIKDEGE